jgi:hypothetical protein
MACLAMPAPGHEWNRTPDKNRDALALTVILTNNNPVGADDLETASLDLANRANLKNLGSRSNSERGGNPLGIPDPCAEESAAGFAILVTVQAAASHDCRTVLGHRVLPEMPPRHVEQPI